MKLIYNHANYLSISLTMTRHVEEEEEDKSSYYYLSHEAIDSLYLTASSSVPMQDWHYWVEEKLDTAVAKYRALDEAERNAAKLNLSTELYGVPSPGDDSERMPVEENNSEPRSYEDNKVTGNAAVLETPDLATPVRSRRADSAAVIGSFLSGLLQVAESPSAQISALLGAK